MYGVCAQVAARDQDLNNRLAQAESNMTALVDQAKGQLKEEVQQLAAQVRAHVPPLSLRQRVLLFGGPRANRRGACVTTRGAQVADVQASSSEGTRVAAAQLEERIQALNADVGAVRDMAATQTRDMADMLDQIGTTQASLQAHVSPALLPHSSLPSLKAQTSDVGDPWATCCPVLCRRAPVSACRSRA